MSTALLPPPTDSGSKKPFDFRVQHFTRQAIARQGHAQSATGNRQPLHESGLHAQPTEMVGTGKSRRTSPHHHRLRCIGDERR